MPKKKYIEHHIIQSLKKKEDIRINDTTVMVLARRIYDERREQYVDNPFRSNDVGNSSWGKIDFLTNFCDFKFAFVREF